MALNTVGSNRDRLSKLDQPARDKLIQQRVLFDDPRRWRPCWFDGRFLAAADLQAEQNYFLVRQADLGRASGSGIIDGLMVAEEANTERLQIEPGSGVTDRGELIVLPEILTVAPADVPEIQRLDAAFGLQVIPNEPGRNRTGLYVLGLRLVEWTANPIGAYPTSLTGRRSVEDGTIVEGVAVTLIPYPDTGNEQSWPQRRARAAREIFVKGKDRGLDSGVLPLALVALRGNLIEWVDPFMVRRETGAERPAGMDFGFGARALREAHLLQYQRHLADALDLNNDAPFGATAYFDALPPVGQFPAGTLDAARLTQRFFPAGIEVELSFVPEDELPAVIEESLLLPPIDLTQTVEELAGTGVIVLVPLPRALFDKNRRKLPNFDAELPQLRPVFLQIKGLPTPKELLVDMRVRALPPPPAINPPEEPWRDLLRTALEKPLLWYVLRRYLPIPSNIAGTPVSATNVGTGKPIELRDLIRNDLVLGERMIRLREFAPEATALTNRFVEKRLVDRPELIKSMLAKAGGKAGTTLRAEEVVASLAPAADPQLGDGLATLEEADPALGRTLKSTAIIETGVLADVDKLARRVPAEKRAAFVRELKVAAESPDTLAVKLNDLNLRFAKP